MELRDYINVIRARKWVIIQAVVIVTLAAAAYSAIQPKSYESTALVLISDTNAGTAIVSSSLANLSTQPEMMETQAELVGSRPIAEAAIKKLNLQTSPEALLSQVTVVVAPQTDIIKITVVDSSAKGAADVANAMADAYVASARDAKRESIAAAADQVQARLDQAKSDIIDLGHKITTLGSTSDLQAELQIATGTYSTLAEKLEQLRINEQLETGPGRVVSAAVVESAPTGPKTARNTGVGFIFGLVLGIAIAFLYEYLDNTIKSPEEIERLFVAPVLGTIPMDRTETSGERRLAIIQSPGSSTAEAYRVLRNSLDFINFEQDMKTVLVTSAAPGEGKSTVAANLAMALAQAGKKVVLVSTDFRRPTTDHFLAVNNLVGLSDVLVGTHPLKAALQRPGDEQLLVLTSGKMPPNPSELLGSEKMRDVIKALGEWGEWVIVDSPPLLAVADPAAVARWADGVLIVSKAGVLTRDAASKAHELLEKVGARTLGVVVWGIDENDASGAYGHYAGGYYYYSSYYSSGRQTPSGKQRSGSEERDGDSKPWVPEQSLGSRLAGIVGRAITALFAFIVTVGIALAVLYVLDQYFAWGLLVALRHAVGL